MIIRNGISAAIALLTIAGCAGGEFKGDENRALNAWLANTVKDVGIENAVIRQRTLYPYHFVSDSADLNDLGKADLRVLASHYRNHPGTLNVRRGEEPEALYDSRLDEVHRHLEDEHVDVSAMAIGDDYPGGDGASSQSVYDAMTETNELYQPEGDTSIGGSDR